MLRVLTALLVLAFAAAEARPRLVSMDFRDADLGKVAEHVSRVTGRNILLSEQVRGGKITILAPRPVTRAEAFRAFLSALELNALTVVRSGKMWKVARQADAKGMAIPTYVDPKR